jgi:hypothetical protein
VARSGSGFSLRFLVFVPTAPNGSPADRFIAEPGAYGIEREIELGWFLCFDRIE